MVTVDSGQWTWGCRRHYCFSCLVNYWMGWTMRGCDGKILILLVTWCYSDKSGQLSPSTETRKHPTNCWISASKKDPGPRLAQLMKLWPPRLNNCFGWRLEINQSAAIRLVSRSGEAEILEHIGGCGWTLCWYTQRINHQTSQLWEGEVPLVMYQVG